MELLETRHERIDGKFRFFDETEDYELPTDSFTGSVQATEEAPNRRRISLGRKRHEDNDTEESGDEIGMDSSWEGGRRRPRGRPLRPRSRQRRCIRRRRTRAAQDPGQH
ncbi:MAG: hypothetical protein O3C27_16555 [Actinomycetota bacterium]|nr:hypothetical protein [Actinomycetota bacterium]